MLINFRFFDTYCTNFYLHCMRNANKSNIMQNFYNYFSRENYFFLKANTKYYVKALIFFFQY